MKPSGLLWRVARTVLMYGWFIGLSVSMTRLFEYGFLSQYRAMIGWGAHLVIWIGSTVLSFFALYSCMRQFALNDTERYRVWASSGSVYKSRGSDAVWATVKSPAFLCETAVLIAMDIAIPAEIAWRGLSNIIFTYLPTSDIVRRVLIDALIATVATVLHLCAHRSAEKTWQLDAKAREMVRGTVGRTRAMVPGWRRLLIYGFFTTLGYLFVSFVGVMVLFTVGAALYTLAGFLSWQVVAVLLCLFLLLIGFRYLRAIRAVKRFKKDLIKLCREAGYTCSDITRLYRSVLTGKRCGTFTVLAGGKRYVCCLVSAVRRGNRMYLDGVSCMHEYTLRLFRRTLFRYYHTTAFEFPDVGERIVIIHPAPNSILVQKDGTVREGETGDCIADYTLYKAKNFLGCLSRDCLGKN